MSLFYVTGTSGSGKSSVCERLSKLGFEAYDTDESVNDWYDRETGEVVTFKPESPDQTTEWVKTHDFLMSEQKVSELAGKAKSSSICS
jgi:dephospho-CoA kinase